MKTLKDFILNSWKRLARKVNTLVVFVKVKDLIEEGDEESAAQEIDNFISLVHTVCAYLDLSIIIDLDGTFGYLSTFIPKAFHYLRDTSDTEFKKIFKFISQDQPGLVEEIHLYINRQKR